MDLTGDPNPDAEVYESDEVVDRKAQELVDLIKKSKHFIAFTGAGVSTSAGIPDFRGPDGNWTLRAQGRERKEKVNTLTAVPTPSHMALVELQNRGLLKYLVSQNCDGLHRRSGILSDRIAELHGNSNREYCKDCGKEYLRDFRAVATYEHSDTDHRTGRKCDVCQGALHDSIVNFGEFLEEKVLASAYANAKKADLCLVLGSSLHVPPANKVPTMVGASKRKNTHLVICNLQPTELDHLTKLRVFSKADTLMTLVMSKLAIPIPPFKLHRRLVLSISETKKGREKFQVEVKGVDVDGTPMSFLKSVRLEGSRRVGLKEPFLMGFSGEGKGEKVELKLLLEFMGHYGEPGLEVVHVYGGEGEQEAVYDLEVDPLVGVWDIVRVIE